MRSRGALVVLSLVAWIAGSTLGTVTATAPAHAATPFLKIGQAHAGYVPTLNGTSPIFILFIGSDARPGEPVAGERTDSLHLVAINPAKHKASILGFPRDSWVEIPGYGMNKINAAMVNGGPALTVQTVENLTGIKIDYWALTSFDGITNMINQIGGLTVDVPFAMQDHYSHADFAPGVQLLDGRQVLSFARDRHSIPSGDFGRSENQGRVFIATLAQFRKEFAKDPSRLLTYIGAGLRNVQTNVPLDQILSLAFTSTTINPKHVQNMVVPGGTSTVGGMSVVNLSADAVNIYNDMKNDGLVSKKNVPPSPNQSLLGG